MMGAENRTKKRDIHNGSTLNGVLQPTEDTESECCQTSSHGLHYFKCLPTHLRFNPFVHTGYRLNLNTWECLKSLLYFHNETFNIYSHGLASVALLCLVSYVYRETVAFQLYPVLYSIHYVASILCVFCSATYHLLLCHKNGAKTYDKLIKLDMVGIWFVITFGSTAFIYATFFCYPVLFKAVYCAYSLLGLTGFWHIMRGRNASERLRPVIYLGMVRFPMYATRGLVSWLGYTTGKVYVIWLLIIMELFGLFGSAINVNRFPEKWLGAGKFDYLGNSHNIMHIIVLICPIWLHLATVADFKWLETANCSA